MVIRDTGSGKTFVLDEDVDPQLLKSRGFEAIPAFGPPEAPAPQAVPQAPAAAPAPAAPAISKWNIPARLAADWKAARARPVVPNAPRDDMSLPLQMMVGGALGKAMEGRILARVAPKFMPEATEEVAKTYASNPNMVRQLLPDAQKIALEKAKQATSFGAAAQQVTPGLGTAAGTALGAATEGVYGGGLGGFLGNMLGRRFVNLPTGIKGMGEAIEGGAEMEPVEMAKSFAKMVYGPAMDAVHGAHALVTSPAVHRSLVRTLTPAAQAWMALHSGNPSAEEYPDQIPQQ